MKLRSWIFVLLLIFSAYGSAAIIAAHYGQHWPTFNYYSHWFLINAAPWITIIGGFIAWSKAWKWRVMSNEKIRVASQLSRGKHTVALPKDEPGGFEFLATRIIWLSIFSVPYYFHIPQPEWVSVSILMVWVALKTCFRNLKSED